MDKYCCVCLENSIELSKIVNLDTNGVSFIAKLDKYVSQIKWSEEFDICLNCIETLNIVENFVEKCIKSDLNRTTTRSCKKDTLKTLQDCFKDIISDNEEEDETYQPSKVDYNNSDSENEDDPKEIVKTFTCEKCSLDFTDLKAYSKHCTDIHKIQENVRPYCVKPFYCEICKSRFVQEKSYNRHMKHHKESGSDDSKNTDEAEDLKCKYCEKIFSNTRNLKRHLNNKHADEINAVKVQFSCENCQQSFTSKWNLNRHAQRCLPNSIRKKKILKCVLCNYYKDTRENVVNHYSSYHGIDVVTKKIMFRDFKDFEVWKEEVEKDTVSKFVKGSFHKNQDKDTNYYRCHRDGFYKNAGKNIRRLKQLGSNKIDGVCPARIQATFNKNNQEVYVEYTETHVGHTMDLKRIPLKKSDRNFLAKQIEQKIPFDDLINNVRNNIGINNFSRIQLLTKKDLFNIEQLYKLNKTPKNTPKKLHICPTCGKQYKIARMLRSHIAKNHTNIHHTTPSITDNTPHQNLLQNTFEESEEMCLVCDERFPGKSFAKEHMKFAHNVAFEIKYETLDGIDVSVVTSEDV